nr:MAG TPA: hypothetical protein [Caudoviricetes sp.]
MLKLYYENIMHPRDCANLFNKLKRYAELIRNNT